MDFTHISAGDDDSGRRLDRILRRYLDGASLSGLYKSLRSGLIKLNGKKCGADARVAAGDDIAIASFLCGAAAPSSAPAAVQKASPFPKEKVLFRSADLLIVNKPYDLLVQPSAGSAGALSTLIEDDYAFFHPETESIAFRPGPLHRLDRKTTGAVCASQSLRGARWFSRIMQAHEIGKHYVALVCGRLEQPCHWEDRIEKRQAGAAGSPAFHTVESGGPGGRAASTRALPLAYGSLPEDGRPVTLVQFSIQTGRTHQIRAQSAGHGFPLLGDTAYGGPRLTGCGQDFFLHAYELHFPRNDLGIPALVRAPIMTFFEKMLSKTLIKWDGRLILKEI